MAKKVRKPAKKVELDMLGDPAYLISDRWGRPKHRKSKQNQRLVALMKMDGHSQAEIADELNCDEKTLRKYYSRELLSGALRIKSQMLEIIYNKALGGNVSAAGKIMKIADDRLLAAPEKIKPRRVSKEAALGKKAEIKAAADNPAGEWMVALSEDDTIQ